MSRPDHTPNLSAGQLAVIKRLLHTDLSKKKIAEKAQCSRQTVYNYLKKKP